MSGLRGRGVWVVSLLLVAALVTLLPLTARGSGRNIGSEGAGPPAAQATAATVTTSSGESGASVPPPRREPASGPSTLRIRLLGPDGVPVPGHVAWHAPETGIPTLPPLDAVESIRHGWSMTGEGFGSIDAPTGEAVIELASPRWFWARGSGGTGSPGPVHLRLPPFAGERTQLVQLHDGGFRVHVQVYSADLKGPGCGVAVECLDGDGALVWRGSTDQDGYACVAPLAQGTFRVRLAECADDAGDHQAVVRFLPTERARDAVVVLAVPERRVRLTGRIEARFASDSGQRPLLLLRRVDPGREVVACAVTDLRPGTQSFEVHVPAGTYEPVVLPQGRLVFPGGAPQVVAGEGPGDEIVFSLEAGGATFLELRGIPDEAMPVTVRLVSEEELIDVADPRIWLGPARWHRRREQVDAWEGAALVVARNRNSTWISREAVSAAREETVIEMLSATLLEVRSDPRQGGEVVSVAAGKSEVVRLLRRSLRHTPAGRVPAARAVIPVPRGDARVQLWRGDGTLLAARQIRLDAPHVGVDL